MQIFSYKNKLYSIILTLLISSCASGVGQPYQYRFVEPYGNSDKSNQYWSIFKVDYSQVEEKKTKFHQIGIHTDTFQTEFQAYQ